MRTPQNSVCGGTSPFLLTSDVGSDDHDSRLAIADLIIFPSPPLRDPKMSLSHMQAYDDGEWWQALICDWFYSTSKSVLFLLRTSCSTNCLIL
ncbi:hypothetical protein HanRHA438_Chr09g0411801 [Helianthus annuus]|nr:hypothetical protein HanRHA438_Chr09g0411801 [Helianthus annuus]